MYAGREKEAEGEETMIELVLIILSFVLGISGVAYGISELGRMKEVDREMEASYFRMKWIIEEMKSSDEQEG
jgi:hypothetical protein